MLGAIAKAFFAVNLLVHMVWTTALMHLVHLLPVSIETKEGMCLRLVQIAWGLALFFSPWVRCTPDQDYMHQWSIAMSLMAGVDAEARAHGTTPNPLFIISNHQCFFDTILAASRFPGRVMWRIRTYMTSTLFNMPILCTVCKSVGHFPVYFKSAEAGKFKVDSDRMEEVEKRVDHHLQNGGWLCFFPEGQLNADPDKILPFRFGGMQRALDYDARVVSFVSRGNTIVWPRTAPVGGFPGQVRYNLKIFAPDGTKAFVKKARAEGRKDEKDMEDARILASRLQDLMQAQYDDLSIPNGKAAAHSKED